MKRSDFPLEIELEMKNVFGNWMIVYSCIANDNKSLYFKLSKIKTTYQLDDKEYRIFLRIQSKLNNM